MDEGLQKTLRLIDGQALTGESGGRCEVGPGETSDVELLDAYSRAVIKVVDAVGPAVVGISVGQPRQPAAGEPAGLGSGVVITPDGYILTNDHVVHGARQVTATLSTGVSFPAVIAGSAPPRACPMRRWETPISCGWDNWSSPWATPSASSPPSPPGW
jgi:S1-C subfamily serine protease